MEFAFVGAKMSVFVLKYASQHFRKATAIHIFVPMKIRFPSIVILCSQRIRRPFMNRSHGVIVV